MAVLGEGRYNSYIDRMVRYLIKEYPRQFQARGLVGTREFVTAAIQKGRRNHVEAPGGLAVLIELMVAFGDNFQNSPHHD